MPVTLGGVCVYPGDLLHADLNGVSDIPKEIASEVPGACKEFMAAEEVVLGYLKGTDVTPGGMAAARDECGSMIAKIAERVRRG